MAQASPALSRTWKQIASGPCFIQNTGIADIEVFISATPPTASTKGTVVPSGTPLNNQTASDAVYARITGALISPFAYGVTVTGANLVTSAPPINTAAPSISGGLQVGQTLTVSNGTWNNSPNQFLYQWYRGNTPFGDGGTQAYTLTEVDAGWRISCDVTAVNGDGQTTASAASVGPVQAVPGSSLRITGSPSAGVVGAPYDFAPTVSGGTAPYRVELAAVVGQTGAPPELGVVSGSGRTGGTVRQGGTFSWRYNVTDATGARAWLDVQVTFQVVVGRPALPVLLSGTYAAVYGSSRMVAEYTGPIARISRADGQEQDVYPAPLSSDPDDAATEAWAGGQNIARTVLLYDQSGNGKHGLPVSAIANRPLWRPAAAEERGRRPVVINTFPTRVDKWLFLPDGLNLNRGDMAVHSVTSRRSNTSANHLFSLQAVAGTDALAVYYDYGLNTKDDSAVRLTQTFQKVGIQTFGYANRSGGGAGVVGEHVWLEGVKRQINATPRSAAALTAGGRISMGATAGSGSSAFHSLVFINGAATDADMAALDAWGVAAFNINTTPITRNVAWMASSVIHGYAASNGRNPPWLIDLGDKTRVVSNARTGRRQAEQYATRDSIDANSIVPGIANFFIIDGIGNDLAEANSGNDFADQATAEAWADNIFNTVTTPYLVWWSGKAGVSGGMAPTQTPRVAWQGTNKEFARLRYNSRVRTYLAANNLALADLAAVPELANPGNLTYYNGDGIHPNDLGTDFVTSAYRAALMAYAPFAAAA